jgi:cysteine desulfurase/selenocysteine lyase
MESSRRKFIRQLLAGSAGALLATSTWAQETEQDLPALSTPDGQEPDWEALRGQFQFIPTQLYFNTGTIGLLPQSVVDAMQASLVRLRQGDYLPQAKVREKIAELVHAPAESIALTHNTTHGINLVAQGLRLQRGDEVILTDQEHAGNALPWLQRARLDRLRIRVLTPGPDAATTLLALERLVTKRTRVIAIPHITCTTGQVLPVQQIIERYRDRVPHIFLDGAHGPGTTPLDLTRLDCGYYAACGHKWLCGPAGTGFLYIRPDLLEQVEPRFTGAGSDNGWQLDAHTQAITGWAAGAQRFEIGTQNRVLIEGLHAAILFWEGVGWEALHARVRYLQAQLRARLAAIPGLELLTPEEAISSASMLTFRAADLARRQSLLEFLASHPQYRVRRVQESGLQAVRISTHAYTSMADVEALADLVESWRS